MKRMVCEMCGGSDLIKDEGVFVCQSCGCKYSVDEAKKMMVEIAGTVEVKGNVAIDQSDVLNNYITRGNQLFEKKEYAEAEVYYNKALDIDAKSTSVMNNFLELANRLFKEKRYLKAEDYYIKALDIDPDNTEAKTGLQTSRSIILEPNLTIIKSAKNSIFESKTYLYIDNTKYLYDLRGTTNLKLPIGNHTIFFKNQSVQSEIINLKINGRNDKYTLGFDVKMRSIKVFLMKSGSGK